LFIFTIPKFFSWPNLYHYKFLVEQALGVSSNLIFSPGFFLINICGIKT
jgi:hypothetical protein